MSTALFINYPEPACGVAQFGRNLWQILKDSQEIEWHYAEPQTVGELRTVAAFPEPDFILYNWQSGQGGFLAGAPFDWLSAKQYLVYHDNDVDESRWSGILFSDPDMPSHGKWHSIGRPIPKYCAPLPNKNSQFTVGCNGFLGAWADEVVKRVMQEFEAVRIRLLLPYSAYCDPNGDKARAMAERCRAMVKGTDIALNISHNFLEQSQLLDWLAANDLNCYIRPLNNWRGVSSAPDCALAVRKPMAVNCCQAFRHLHNLQPSIVVDESSLMDIIGNGLSPLVKLYSAWSPENIRKDVETVLLP